MIKQSARVLLLSAAVSVWLSAPLAAHADAGEIRPDAGSVLYLDDSVSGKTVWLSQGLTTIALNDWEGSVYAIKGVRGASLRITGAGALSVRDRIRITDGELELDCADGSVIVDGSIYAAGSTLTMQEGTLRVNGSAIDADTIRITGGFVCSRTRFDGIRAEELFLMEGGIVESYGGDHGLHVNGEIRVTGGSLSLSGGSSPLYAKDPSRVQIADGVLQTELSGNAGRSAQTQSGTDDATQARADTGRSTTATTQTQPGASAGTDTGTAVEASRNTDATTQTQTGTSTRTDSGTAVETSRNTGTSTQTQTGTSTRTDTGTSVEASRNTGAGAQQEAASGTDGATQAPPSVYDAVTLYVPPFSAGSTDANTASRGASTDAADAGTASRGASISAADAGTASRNTATGASSGGGTSAASAGTTNNTAASSADRTADASATEHAGGMTDTSASGDPDHAAGSSASAASDHTATTSASAASAHDSGASASAEPALIPVRSPQMDRDPMLLQGIALLAVSVLVMILSICKEKRQNSI